MIPSSPLYQIGGKRVSFCVAFLMLLALFLIPIKTFARYEIIDEMRYNIIDDYAENIAQMVPPYRSVGTARSGSVVPLISV